MSTSRRNPSFRGLEKGKERMFSAPRADKLCCKKNRALRARVEREEPEPGPPGTGSHRDTKSPAVEEANRKIREPLAAMLNYHSLWRNI